MILGAPRKKPSKNAQATRAGDLIFTVGAPFNWDTGEVVGTTIAEQTRQTLENIKTTLAACGSSMNSVDKCTVFVSSGEIVPGMNEVYYSYFPETTPVRTCVVVQFPNARMLIEMEAIAHVEGK